MPTAWNTWERSPATSLAVSVPWTGGTDIRRAHSDSDPGAVAADPGDRRPEEAKGPAGMVTTLRTGGTALPTGAP